MNSSIEYKEKFVELFNANKNKVYNFALKMLKDKDTAEDITQETFIKLYNNLSNGSSISSPKNWLFIITRNLCLNELRDKKNKTAFDNIQNHDSPIFNNVDIRYLRLRKALNNLDVKYREALVLKEYQGFSYNEIAQILNITVSAVRAR